MELKDWVPLLAFVLSAGSLGWQAVTAFRNRRRLVVTARIVTSWSAPSRQAFFVLVTTRSHGGKNGIEQYDFEWEPQPVSWGMSPADVPLTVPAEANPVTIADVFNANKVLDDGEVVHKMFALRTGQRPSGVDRKYQVTAVVEQSNGKKWRANPVTMLPMSDLGDGPFRGPEQQSG